MLKSTFEAENVTNNTRMNLLGGMIKLGRVAAVFGNWMYYTKFSYDLQDVDGIITEMIKIISGGKKHASWLKEVCDEYEKRLRKPWALEWQFIDEDKLDERVARLKPDDFVVLLDENGKMMSSPELAHVLREPLENSRDVVVIIGGAFGHFSPDILARANVIWSLSKLVFPHQICRLIVVEQIYRAQEIYLEHAYHHA